MTIRSIEFPFVEGDLSFPKGALDQAAIRASLIQVVCTGRGERVMRPNFGCNAFSYVFESNTGMFRNNVEREIRMAVAAWEPRVEVNEVRIETGDGVSEPGQMIISIFYTIRASGLSDSVTVAGGQ